MSTINVTKTAPINLPLTAAIVGIATLAIAGLLWMPTLDAMTGLVVFMVSVATLLIVATGLGLHKAMERQSQLFIAFREHSVAIILMTFGAGASLASTLFSLALAATIGGTLLLTTILLYASHKRESSRTSA
jgi:hypothetical protein